MRRLLSVFVFVLVLAGSTALAPLGLAQPAASPEHLATTRYPLNPSHNIAVPDRVYGPACEQRPQQSRCEDILIDALDHARSVLSQPRYALPTGFRSLTARDQLLVLSNLDRALYGRVRIRGRNSVLDANAQVGVRDDADPRGVYVVDHQHMRWLSSNWAGGTAPMGSPLFAYYLWMYDDGYGSGNADCQHPGDSGCWGHRDDTLMRVGAASDQVEMGVGGGRDTRGNFGWTELYESFDGSGVIPCIPTVTGLSRHVVRPAGETITVYGMGFVRVSTVTALGRAATVLARHRTSLTIRLAPHAAGRGYVVVHTSDGRSATGYATELRYQT
jgi:hypothetical protein